MSVLETSDKFLDEALIEINTTSGKVYGLFYRPRSRFGSLPCVEFHASYDNDDIGEVEKKVATMVNGTLGLKYNTEFKYIRIVDLKHQLT